MVQGKSPSDKDGSNRTAAAPAEQAAAAAAVSQAPATVQRDEQHAGSNNDEREESGCPICQFIEAGPCGDEHKAWVGCRQEAKNDGVDFVQHCAEQFRTFFGCMLKHQEYYAPFLEAFHVDVEKSQEAIENPRQQEEQQQQQQQPDTGKPEQQQQQQQHSSRAEPTSSQPPGGSSGSISSR